MIKTPIGLQDLRRRIYAKAKAEPSWRFWGLFVHVCKMETLRAAYAMAIELLRFRDLHPLRDLPSVMAQSATLVGAVVMGTSLVAGAFLISKYSCHGSCPWSKMKMEQPKVEQQRFTVQVQPNPALKK